MTGGWTALLKFKRRREEENAVSQQTSVLAAKNPDGLNNVLGQRNDEKRWLI